VSHLGGAIAPDVAPVDANTWMPDVWGYLVVRFGVGIVLDVGCGYGHACKWFADLGLNIVGIEGDPKAVEHNVCKSGRIIQHDFTRGTYVHGTPFDLAWSCEFLEHLEEQYLQNLRPCFEAARYAVITHGEPWQDGHHHVNCQPDSYWERVFDSWGFLHLRQETALLRRTDRYRAVWGRRSLMVFERI
jgi:SAM-dependent methyltransferase